jgi:hypothetical protein
MARTLAGKVSSMEQASAKAAVALVCKLVYSISGKDSSATLIQKTPPPLLESTQMRFIFSALNALQPAKKLELNFPQMIWSYDFSSEIHSIVALGKMVKYIVTLLFGCSTSIFFSKKNNNKVVVIRLLVVNLG